ncbi:TetR/AcrR family transcriptional regulator [Luteimicrobium sp. NPDC057192]|uniref:TetR/AcrR family transcriptional regulator n=1 Tax=Luteimicrobium sp. NPDC057192 TaxID=3346042 RepID=UPI00363E62F4
MNERLSHEERREQLVEAALAVALREGVEAVTIRSVAREAGVRPGIIHYVFRDKHEMLAALSRRVAAVASTFLDDALTAGGDITTMMHALADGMWKGIEARSHHQLLTIEIATLGARDDRMRAIVLEQLREQWAASEQYLGAAARLAGVQYSMDIALLARMVSAEIDGIQIAWMVEHDDAAAIASFHAIADAILGTVRPLE